MSTISYDLVVGFDEMIKEGREDEAYKLLRDNRDSLKTLRVFYSGLTPMEIEMKESIEEGFKGRLEKKLSMIGEVIVEGL